MTQKKAKREYLTLTYERADGSFEGMTVPSDVAWEIARGIAAGGKHDNITLIGTRGTAKVFRDGGAYVAFKGEDGKVVDKSTVCMI